MKSRTAKRLKRDKPNKKWTENDVKQILDYLQKAPEIEAPTAQVYYKKFIEISGIDATWDLIRWKVRHLKSAFKKADDWCESTGATLFECNGSISSVEGKVLQMCPNYKQLKEIFGDKNGNGDFTVYDSSDLTNMNDATMDAVEPIPFFPEEVLIKADGSTDDDHVYLSETQTIPEKVSKKLTKFPRGMMNRGPKTSAAAHFSAFQADRTLMTQMRLDWEKEKYIKEFALNEKKLKLEEEKVKAEREKVKAEIEIKNRELDLKIMQLEKEERIKVLEIEKNTFIRKFEIEMKYKFQLQK